MDSINSSKNSYSIIDLKFKIKHILQKYPYAWSRYWKIKQQVRRILLLRYFAYDITNTYRAMFWDENHTDRITLGAELLFQFHKLEKGLVMPGPKRLFGAEPAIATMKLCDRWLVAKHDATDPIFVGAIQTVVAYEERLRSNKLDPQNRILGPVQQFLKRIECRDDYFTTPRPQAAQAPFSSFMQLAQARRSIRSYKYEPVQTDLIVEATQAAQLSPSACNRQPCGLVIVSDNLLRESLLSHQNGNRGFGHLAPHVAVVTVEEQCFFDASERHEPYIDGGMFAMSFILALRDNNIGSCCLNWCVPPSVDKLVHELLGISSTKRIVMLIAIGYNDSDCMIPFSARRNNDAIIEFR